MIGYARVSTSDQNPDLQLDALRAAGCENVFVERISGVSTKRPELVAALDAATPGDVLVVWKLDRLGRSLLNVLEMVRDLDARGIGFRSLTESIDTTSSTGRLVLQIFGAIAEFERTIIIERTMAGLASARARGRVGGRPRKMDHEDIARARALMLGTEANAAIIAAQFGVATSTLYRYLRGDALE